MQELPISSIYEQEFAYMPWGILIQEVLDYIEKNAGKGARVLDMMCGPGYLLGEIHKRRKDLKLEGFDRNPEYVRFAQKKYTKSSFRILDVLDWKPEQQFDVVLCTAGIHHIPYAQQSDLIKKISQGINKNGFAVLADPYVSDFKDEQERKLSASQLGHEYILATIRNGAPQEVVRASIDILYNDVMGDEFKSSVKKLEPTFKKFFSFVEKHKTWPQDNVEYGDYYFICKK